MGYARALLARDVGREEKALQKKVKKKSLWGSIGRTAGGLLAMGLTGGLVNPLTLGLISGGASFLGGAIGAKAAGGKLTGGKFFKSDRESLQKELGAFGTQNLMSSLKSGITAGIGQKLTLMKSGKEAAKLSEGFGLDFKGSMLGKGLERRAIGKELIKAGEESLGTDIKTRGGSSGLLELPEGVHGPPALSSRSAVASGRGYMAPGEITSKLETGGFVPSVDESKIGTATSKSTFIKPKTGYENVQFGSGVRGDVAGVSVKGDIPYTPSRQSTIPSAGAGYGQFEQIIGNIDIGSEIKKGGQNLWGGFKNTLKQQFTEGPEYGQALPWDQQVVPRKFDMNKITSWQDRIFKD